MLNALLYVFIGLNLLLFFYITIAVARQWRVSKAHRRFVWFTLLSFLWLLDVVFQAYRESPITWSRYIFVTHLNFALAPLVAAAMISFALHFPRNNIKVDFKKEVLMQLPLLVLAVLSCTNLFVTVTGFRSIGVAPAYLIYISIFIIYALVFVSFLLLKKIKNSTGIIRIQLLYITIGYLTAMVVLVGESIYMNLVNMISPNVDLLSTNISFLFVALTAYAMLRYRFMDIRVVIKKSAIYAISLLSALALYTYGVLLLKDTIEKNWQVNTTWTAVILIMLVAIGFPPLKNLVERTINAIFKGKKNIDLAVKEVREKIAEKTDLQTLVDLICTEVKKYLEVTDAELYVIDHKEQRYSVEDGGELKAIELKNDLVRYFEKYQSILIREEIPHVLEEREGAFERDMLQKAEKEMKKHKISLAMPLRTEEEIFGLLFLGSRADDKPYSVQDVQYLEKVREQATFTLANALLYKEALARVSSLHGEVAGN